MIGILPYELQQTSESVSRRHFCRIATMVTLSTSFKSIWASNLSTENSRLVAGQLASWRSHPSILRLEVAFRFLQRPDLSQLAVGRHEIEDKAYATISKSISQAPALGQFEAHRKYIDVHYMISGQSLIGFAPIEELKTITPYGPVEDAATYGVPKTYTKVEMYPGNFAVFFTGGGHMPNCDLNGAHKLHTVVVKVEQDYGL